MGMSCGGVTSGVLLEQTLFPGTRIHSVSHRQAFSPGFAALVPIHAAQWSEQDWSVPSAWELGNQRELSSLCTVHSVSSPHSLLVSKVQVSCSPPLFPYSFQPDKGVHLPCVRPQNWGVQSVALTTHSLGRVSALFLPGS